jgi:hypothetical protein
VRIDTFLLTLLMPMLRLPGGCIAIVPISPGDTKIPFRGRFGLAGLSRDAIMLVDHPRWSRRVFYLTVC